MAKRIKEEDMVGKRFGRLTVLRATTKEDLIKYNKPLNRRQWLCKCDCGNECVVTTGNLNGTTTSCGCYKKEALKSNEIYVGLRINKVTVIEELDKRDYNRNIIWKCKCDCGNIFERSSDELHKYIKFGFGSCGCNVQDSFKKYYSFGDENPHYKPELTKEDREDKRQMSGYYTWKTEVLRNANYTCECCGTKDVKVIAHHKDGYHWCEERRTDVTNGVCLCEECHHKFHKLYSNRNNTEEQYKEFLERMLD